MQPLGFQITGNASQDFLAKYLAYEPPLGSKISPAYEPLRLSNARSAHKSTKLSKELT